MRSTRPRAVRWVVPAACLAAIVALAVVPGTISGWAASAPDLPELTPLELLTKVQSSQVDTLSGTVQLRNDLGLPDLGGLGGGGGADAVTALLAGTHEARIAISGADHVRIALPDALAETNWILAGDDVWSWDSESQRVVHVSLAGAADDHPRRPDRPDANPADLAQRLLDAVTPSTDVSVRAPRYVAGRAVYELALVPRSGASTVGEVAVAVDAETGLALDVRITASGAASPAFELGFTSVSFEAPPASTFEFTPPAGATVVEAPDASALASPGTESYHRRHHTDATAAADAAPAPEPTVDVVGAAWDCVAVVSGASLPPEIAKLFGTAPRVEAGNIGGRLVSTKLVNAVLLDDGRIVIGAVGPDALLAAVTPAA